MGKTFMENRNTVKIVKAKWIQYFDKLDFFYLFFAPPFLETKKCMPSNKIVFLCYYKFVWL